MTRCVVLFGFWMTLLMAGCGGPDRPSLVKASGKVTLDGKPVEGAMVFLTLATPDPKYKRPARATTDAQGVFSPGTYGDGKDGLPLGKYKVGVQKTEFAEKVPENFNSENPGATPVKMRWLIPKAYSDPETSGLRVEVTSSGMTPPEIQLESGGAKPVVESTAGKPRGNEP